MSRNERSTRCDHAGGGPADAPLALKGSTMRSVAAPIEAGFAPAFTNTPERGRDSR